MKRRHHLRPPSRDAGSVAVWLLLIAPLLLAFAGLVLDGGRVLTARQKAANIAEQAARAAVDAGIDITAYRASDGAIDQLDAGLAHDAACTFVAAAHPGAGCQTTVDGDQVTVEVTLTTETAVLAAVGVPQLTTTSEGTARPATGLTTALP